ncbi:hypothetical protein [Dethiosulfatarculus sandiegensis]|uniref:VWA-like domain-containing protein n=1 Tax=Dethiosulfatarculus sandiegensis TaxID=1429043 RepID=A0A0D2J2Z9_9BACT|nr:hypothetical protein [Dethiosulfatarculus sandiegensis]KIX12539.1 hypothetical protein X474_18215 [Dethiosulfatarculus sandiegensis]
MDSLLVELAKKNELARAGRRLDEILFRFTRNSPIKNKALNNIWMFLHHAEVVPDNHEYKTSHIDLKQNKITINRSFLIDHIKNVNDLAFIVLRERHHIALRYLHEVDISRILYYQHNINISLQAFLEDTYINGIVRRSVDTDLPERFYGYFNEEKPGMERWLMHPKYFDIYKPDFDLYAGTEEAKTYAMLCNIYQYASKSMQIAKQDLSFRYWVQTAYAFFLKYLNQKQTGKASLEGEPETARENKNDNPAGSDQEIEKGDSHSKSAGGEEEQKTGDRREGNTGGSGEFLYQPLSESNYDALQHDLNPEETEFSEQTGHYHKSGSGTYYVSAQRIIPKTREWDASLITQTSDNNNLDLNAQVMLEAKVMEGFMKAAEGLLVQANHRDKQMPFAYMPHRISRPDAFSLSMGAQPIFWQHQVEDVSKKHYAVYFDVSDSMLEYIGYLPCLLKALSGVDYTVYNFSRLVVEMQKHLCGRFYIGSGGTSYKAVAEHILKNKLTHAFILTDGCGSVPEDMLPALQQQLRELIFIKLGDSPENSEWDFLATQIIEPG